MNKNGNRTVLVIDDDELIRSMMRSMLSRMGYKVICVENGEKAVETVETWNGNIDVAFMDLFLPDIRGDKVIPKIIQCHPEAEIVVMSGYALEDIKVLDSEVHSFIQKPCTYESLSQVLERVFP